jgi:putative transposase
LYYRAVAESAHNLKIMRIMDEHSMKHPGEGVRSMVAMLGRRGYRVNHKRIRRLLRKMGHTTVYPKKNLSKLGQVKYIRPYLLDKVSFTHANQAWSIDITYIPMEKGFMYCTGIMDIYSRKIEGWGVSNSLEAKWCMEVYQKAVEQHGDPKVINSDQGSQFTCSQWIRMIEDMGVKVSMDGKGRAVDNRWIERFWRTLKYKHIYLNPPKDGLELYENVRWYIDYYNTEKVHQTIRETPEERYSKSKREMTKKTTSKSIQLLTNTEPVLV